MNFLNLGIMIAKGRTNIRAEIDFVYDAYDSLIKRVENSYSKDIKNLEGIVQSIEANSNIDYEEKKTELDPYLGEIETLIGQNQKAQEAIFCGIYSFWEKSLYRLCQYYKIEVCKKNGNTNYAPGIIDYLKVLLPGQLDAIPQVLLEGIREFRNYLAHGALSPKRKGIIENISPQDLAIQGAFGNYALESFSELHKVLDLVCKKLQEIEEKQNH